MDLGLAAVVFPGLALSSPVAGDEIRVVATINPVHSLVSGVLAGVGEPHLMVRGAVSPHNFSMRPSGAEMLEEAHVVFLIGEAMETSIAGPIDTLAGDAHVVELFEVEGLVRRPLREGATFEEHLHGGDDDHRAADDGDERHADDDDDHHADGDDGNDQDGDADHGGDPAGSDDNEIGHDGDADHENGTFDMHVWLDPVNAQVMVHAIAQALSESDPGNAETYAANARSLQHRLADLGTEIAAEVAPVRGKPFIVFHDGYRYFEDRFGVVAAGSAVVSADRSPGVRRIRELQQKVRDLGVTCVLTEPQFEGRLVDVIVEGTDAQAGSVDPLGATIDSGPELYFALLRNMAASFTDCLVPA